LLQNEKLNIQGNGMSRRNFIHVDDVCSAIDIIIHKGTCGQIYNIGIQNEHSVMDIANILCTIGKVNIDDNIEYIPDRLFNDVRYNLSSNKLNELGWTCSKNNFVEELENLFEWYKINRFRYE